MVGRLPDGRRAGRLGFAAPGDAIALAGPFAPSLAASELAKLWGRQLPDGLPAFELDAVVAAIAAVRDAVRAGSVSSAHDVAEGGLAVALAECCIASGLGADVAVSIGAGGGADAHSGGAELEGAGAGGDPFAVLFGEGSGGFLLSGERGALEALGAPVIGTVGGERLRIALGEEAAIDASVAELADAHSGGLAPCFP
ncbi:MAG: AIR synthase-related protein, partial [Solirubrobacteraceae bacterium]